MEPRLCAKGSGKRKKVQKRSKKQDMITFQLILKVTNRAATPSYEPNGHYIYRSPDILNNIEKLVSQ